MKEKELDYDHPKDRNNRKDSKESQSQKSPSPVQLQKCWLLKQLCGIKSVVTVSVLQFAELCSTGHTSIIPKFHDPAPPMVWHDIMKKCLW